MNDNTINKPPVQLLTQADLVDTIQKRAFHQIKMEDQEKISKQNRKRRKIKAIQKASKLRNRPI